MRQSIVTILLVLVINQKGESQMVRPPIDFTLSKKVSVSGFCLCKTTVTDLQALTNDFKIVKVEEMDSPEKCYGHDSRFTNGEGYSSKEYPGIVLQKGNDSNYIGKIRLTKDFKGKLPNGVHVDMTNLKLSDVFDIYPEFKDKWNSRGCSDYWRFSNDTIAFYVKIDKKIQPQFPINEAYYYNKPIEGIDLVLSCYGLFNTPTRNLFNEPANEPLFFLDSIRVNRGVLSAYDPSEIAFINVLKDLHAIRVAGPEAKNGAIYVFTLEYVKSEYWHYFKSRSAEYVKAVPSSDKEDGVVYILNSKVLDSDIGQKLFSIDDKTFVDLKVIDRETLAKDYRIQDKKWGIVIKTISDSH